ncbi:MULTISPECIES: aspartate dehydrogenase domain-containing protein [Fusobacterium]|uniref:aspartate dehydrogenase domain-containing protein n=1 Tax=Fusobacterium TaxID=848 RepID=UPI001476AA4B|nr:MULTISPECIES: aspartate dehydrogenase domain-containing protein [Fusobacterium]NME35072.1 DUF108 domain-containing protein [Fusobacterium sp. FSA-380-WT-3A]
MSKIGIIGFGKIGQTIGKHINRKENHKLSFIQDPFFTPNEEYKEILIKEYNEDLYKETDLIVEAATADVLKENIENILKYSDLLTLSVTAFSDEEFTEKVKELCKKYNRHVYFPHGAILGMDGLFDAHSIVNKVTIETIKNPKSLNRTDVERTIVYEGTTREACKLYPRNVNVHATVALAGIGFDKTYSKIISDPEVSTNSHRIHIEGEGIEFTLEISSFSTGGVTGLYTPISACGSIDRIIDKEKWYMFV